MLVNVKATSSREPWSDWLHRLFCFRIFLKQTAKHETTPIPQNVHEHPLNILSCKSQKSLVSIHSVSTAESNKFLFFAEQRSLYLICYALDSRTSQSLEGILIQELVKLKEQPEAFDSRSAQALRFIFAHNGIHASHLCKSSAIPRTMLRD